MVCDRGSERARVDRGVSMGRRGPAGSTRPRRPGGGRLERCGLRGARGNIRSSQAHKGGTGLELQRALFSAPPARGRRQKSLRPPLRPPQKTGEFGKWAKRTVDAGKAPLR